MSDGSDDASRPVAQRHQRLEGRSGAGFVPDTIEPPPTLDRYLVRPRFGSPCDDVTPSPGVVRDAAAEYRWAIVAAVGDEPILRVSLP